MRSINDWHPVASFLYFAAVIFITMFSNHPVFLSISLLGSFVLFALISRRRIFVRTLIYYSLLFVLIALINPLFSHNGETPLFFLNGQAVTKEAFMFGLAIAGMIIAVILWFKCFNEIVTSDKFIYIFGRIVPKLSLIMSMALRFIPLLIQHASLVNKTQKTMGLYTTKSIYDRLRGSFRVFASVLGWSFENAIDTSDSMKARGYGLKGRTYFHIFKIRYWDVICISISILLTSFVTYGMMAGKLNYYYYPVISITNKGIGAISYYLATLLIVLMPVIIEIKENIKWKYLRARV